MAQLPGSELPESPRTYTALDVTLVIAKVLLIVVAWTAIFLGAMLGYIAIPLLALLAFLAAWGGINLLRRLADRHRE
jgi:hypothetical protein